MKERKSKIENNSVVNEDFSSLTLRNDINKYIEIYEYLNDTFVKLKKSKEFLDYEIGKIMIQRIIKYNQQINYLFPIDKHIGENSGFIDAKAYLKKYKEKVDKLIKINQAENELLIAQMSKMQNLWK